MDAVAVEAVIEAPAACSDAERARAALEEALAAARAPRRAGRLRHGTDTAAGHWTVSIGAPPPTPGAEAPVGKSVEAIIVDDAGTVVARRTLTDRSARSCVPLARAVGAWASLVLDAEAAHAKDDPPPTADVSGSSSAGLGALPIARSADPAIENERDGGASSEGEGKRKGGPSIELGSMGYLRNGLSATGGVAGVSPFVTIEVARGWVLRPSVALGRSTSRVSVGNGVTTPLSHLGTRVDFCRRVPGNYIERRGIELDLCAGVDAGLVTADDVGAMQGMAAGRFGMGPAANLRGELGAGIALEIRTLLGANFVNTPLMAEERAPLVFAAAELGVSVRLP